MVTNLVALSGTKEGLEKLINRHFYSNHYQILEDNFIFNPVFSDEKNKEINSKYCIIEKKGRWRFEYKFI